MPLKKMCAQKIDHRILWKIAFRFLISELGCVCVCVCHAKEPKSNGEKAFVTKNSLWYAVCYWSCRRKPFLPFTIYFLSLSLSFDIYHLLFLFPFHNSPDKQINNICFAELTNRIDLVPFALYVVSLVFG